jgi:hypothetical protein
LKRLRSGEKPRIVVGNIWTNHDKRAGWERVLAYRKDVEIPPRHEPGWRIKAQRFGKDLARVG